MSYLEKQRTRIEDLSTDENELFDLSEEQLLMGALWGGSGEVCQPAPTECSHYIEMHGQCVDVKHPDE